MKRVIVIGIAVVALFSCDKDSFQTKPQIKLKTDGNVIIPVNGGLSVELEYTDKEGDVDNIVYIKKERLNSRVTSTVRDTLVYSVPEFPNATKGTIVINLDYQFALISSSNPPNIPGSNPPQAEADTLNMKFVLTDKAGNVSDTAILYNIIVQR